MGTCRGAGPSRVETTLRTLRPLTSAIRSTHGPVAAQAPPSRMFEVASPASGLQQSEEASLGHETALGITVGQEESARDPGTRARLDGPADVVPVAGQGQDREDGSCRPGGVNPAYEYSYRVRKADVYG